MSRWSNTMGFTSALWRGASLPQRGLPNRSIVCEQSKETLEGDRNKPGREATCCCVATLQLLIHACGQFGEPAQGENYPPLR